MKKAIIKAILVSCTISFVLAGCQGTPTPQSKPNMNTFSDRQQTTLKIAGQSLQVEVVNTEQSTAQGLSGRTEIGADGMLFIFPSSKVRHFWMKEMLFPLDIIWINQLKIIGISENVPPPSPSTPTYNLPTYPSPEQADMVLEVPAGFVAAHQVKVGVPISLE